ncbi:tat-interactive protein [Coprinopsis sp. MPI-PUGE-AT-0042]|nr:tat-interactive protein [Coprinopsis sp. MPI-PUGE-AT-0042]
MPPMHAVPAPKPLPRVTYVGQDRRMDEWVPANAVRLCSVPEQHYPHPAATPMVYSGPQAGSSSMAAVTSWTADPSTTFSEPVKTEADVDEPVEGSNNGRKRKRSSGSMSGIDEDDGASRRPRSSSPATRTSSAAPSDDPLLLVNGHPEETGGLEGGKGKAGGKSRTRARLSKDDMSLAAAYTASTAPGAAEEVMMTEEEYDLEQHKKITRQRNFDYVYFDHWKMKTWYYSPYPLKEIETELEEAILPPDLSAAYSKYQAPNAASRAGSNRSRMRASDLFAGVMNRPVGAELPNLYVCDRCLKYFSEGITWEKHQSRCEKTHPPGELVYKRGAHAIREIDGAKQKLYCQFLSLFGKLFIDVKTLFFDTDNFMFYVATSQTRHKEELVGFFSKEKHSFDDYNLACITTFPQHQKQGFGMLMIEFSYELSRRANKIGTPERPLSDLGLRSYLAYWVATIIRFFRHVLTVLPPAAEGLIVRNQATFPDLTQPTPGDVRDPKYPTGRGRKARSLPPGDSVPRTPFDEMDDEVFTKLRNFETRLEEDGSAKTHCHVDFTLQDLARACNLRMDDAAFAMNECGLLTKRIVDEDSEQDDQVNGHDEASDHQSSMRRTASNDVIVITRTLVEEVAKMRNVKPMVMDLRYVCIGVPPRNW